jgi:hypothetical protein
LNNSGGIDSMNIESIPMAQCKKKANGYQRQKLAKAHHKNEFFRKLKHIVNSLCGEDVYSQIPQFVLGNLYNARTHSLKVVVPDGNSIIHPEIRATGKV